MEDDQVNEMNPLKRVEAKYLEASKAGFQALPDILLKAQGRLRISQTEMVTLINILSFWWYEDKLPFPTANTIAKRMGASARTVERAIAALSSKGIILKERDENGRTYLSPLPLVEKLNKAVTADTDYIVRTQNAV